ncbi:MAG TPA: glycine betaine ABC transporter substrate-binding protein [Solirubrobacteraceae bacterium]|jgi:osmoprotectant transport system substrate-binding protein|nr:glycine betaine ABC transporter substrate-binding protein [Solirubrobacteraceae bacterium]
MGLTGRLGRAGLALTAAIALGACGSSSSSTTTTGSTSTTSTGGAALPGKGKPAVTLGDKNFTEELILGQLYAQALRAKGYTVNLKENLGATELVDKLLTSGQIDMYPEYTGTILSVIANQKTPPKTAAAAYAQAKAFEETRGFTLLAATPFYDSDALAVLPAYATAHSLKTIADLKPLGKKVTLIAAPEFATRTEGLVGLKQVYGINPTFKPLSIGLTYTALDSGDANVADVFTTDAQLVGGKYVLLSDPKFVFGFQNVAPVVSKKVLAAEGPAFAQTLNAVSATLSTKAVQTMNAAVSVDKQTAASVAKTFLAANGLG